MLNKLSTVFSRNKLTVLQVIELPSFLGMTGLIDKYINSASKRELAKKIKNSQANQDQVNQDDLIRYLDQLFEMQILILRSSAADAKTNKLWISSLRELLVKIPYTGRYLQIAKNIKEDLDSSQDIVDCTKRAKALFMDHANSAYEDQQEIYQFLQGISEKLQSIYSEINEARETCSNKSTNSNIRNSFKQGMQDLKSTLNSNEDVHSLKNTLNQLVDALQHKVEKELEQDENDTQFLEQKIVGLSNKVKSLEEHASDLENAIRQKHEEAITDPLTKLYNRAAYIQALEKAWMLWKEQSVQATLLVWDIDHFKMLNDRHGHAAGDKVLQSVANKLKMNVEGDDIVARFGGEEFVMLLHNKGVKEGEELAERVRSIIAATEFTYKQQPLKVTISCGVASFSKKDTPTTLFERADKALYKAKRSGRNRVEAFANVA